MDLAGHYEPPFIPATAMELPCCCIVCGRNGLSNEKISEYPFRYIPKSWSVEARTQGLRCNGCTQQETVGPKFYLENDVWIHKREPDRYGPQNTTTFELKTVRRVSHVRTSQVMPVVTLVDGDGNEELLDAQGRRYIREDLIPMTTSNKVEIEVTEEEEMEAAPKSKLKTQAKRVGGALAMGGALALTNEAGDIMLDLAKVFAKDIPMIGFALEHPDGREVAKMIVALVLQTSATHAPHIIPRAESVAKIADLQLTASSFLLLQPRLKELRHHFVKLASLADQLPDFGDSIGELPSSTLGDDEFTDDTKRKKKRSHAEKL
jgi:hypothetical protein